MIKLTGTYKAKMVEIRRRLREFAEVLSQSEKRVFAELCFCICTPQSKAVACDKAVNRLEKSGVLYDGSLGKIRAGLNGVRFPNNKARYIVEARRLFTKRGGLNIKDALNREDIEGTREWLVRNVKGLGYKEASHFLRNIGLGNNLAILDVHILKNLLRYNVIEEIRKNLSRKQYMLIEEGMRRFSKRVKIPMAELDLLFWSIETGKILK
ncbi:MAG: N-glycosylase/DNA lyase [Candidatus Tritonobacter lacicola]|nr:N-glycosylase/DNA lyase [Candidatus Tritonobacter lacicola]